MFHRKKKKQQLLSATHKIDFESQPFLLISFFFRTLFLFLHHTVERELENRWYPFFFHFALKDRLSWKERLTFFSFALKTVKKAYYGMLRNE